MSHTILCRHCGVKVAKTPNQVCVNCKTPKWGYTDTELSKINAPDKPNITKLVCLKCNTLVAKTPNNTCIKCHTHNWGYSDFDLQNGLVKFVPDYISPPIKKVKVKWPLVAAAAAAIVLAIILIPKIFDRTTKENDPIEETTDHGISFDSLAMAVAKVETPNGLGTAFLISPTKLLTAAHVVINDEERIIYQEVFVTFSKAGNKRLKAKVLKTGSVWNNAGRSFFLQDFALLELETPVEIKPLKLGNSDKVKELDEVMTIGHSQGDLNLSFTDGKINSTRYADDSGMATLDLFKHNIVSNPGNSGGPVILKRDGTVIGILVAGRGISMTTRLNVPQGENIANKISNVVRELKAEFDLTR